jgi:hypothetical protein
MPRPLPAYLIALLCLALPAFAFNETHITAGPEVEARENATHIARISKDTIVIVGGSTYLFTVDTPEDQGLVSTAPDVIRTAPP